MITVEITVTSRRRGFVAPDPDVQTYSTYENAARGLLGQRLTTPFDDDSGFHWGLTERGHNYAARLIEGDRKAFDAAMWAVADLSWVARRIADARNELALAMTEGEDFGFRAMRAGRPQAQVARELGVDRMTVRKWISAIGAQPPAREATREWELTDPPARTWREFINFEIHTAAQQAGDPNSEVDESAITNALTAECVRRGHQLDDPISPREIQELWENGY